MPYSALRALRDLRRLPVPRAREVRRRGARRAARRSSTPTSRCSPTPRRCALETNAAGTRRHRGRGRARRRARDATRPTSSSSPAARPTRAKLLLALGQRRAPATGWPTAPTRSGATTCSTTARRCWRCPRSRTRRSSRRRSGSTTSTSAPTTSSTRWATSRWSASRRPTMYRGEKPLRDQARARAGRSRTSPRHAVDFWLSTEDLPRPENRVTLRPTTAASQLTYTADQRRAQEAALPPAQVDARRTSACTTTTCSRATPT